MRLIKYFKIKILSKGTMILFLFLHSVFGLNAQKSELKIIAINNDIPGKINRSYKRTFSDSIKVLEELSKIKNKLISEGYIAVSFDSITFDSLSIHAYLYLGKKYSISKLSIIKEDSLNNPLSNISVKKFDQAVFNPEELTAFYERKLIELENSGYPFAQLIPITINIEEDNFDITIRVEKGPEIIFNNLYVKGNSDISAKYLRRYLNIQKGDVYKEKSVSQIYSKINELNFIKQIRSPELDFFENKADVYVYLNKGKANLFNGIIGFLPQEDQNNKLSVTGDLSIELINNFNRAERINLHWIASGDQSQKLNTGFSLPYIFGSPVGTSFNFKIDKRDTSFVKTNLKGSLDFSFKNNDKIFVYVSRNNSFILSGSFIDTSLFNNSKSFLYGLGYATEKLNYKFNPSKGISFSADIANGNRKTENIENSFFAVNSILELFVPVYKKFVFKLATSHQYLISDFDFYQNELYYAGGFNSIRGFDEDVFLSSGISVVSSELRFLYERNSNVFLFADYGRLKIQNETGSTLKFPFGFGAGTGFSTRAGIFSISYALGKLGDAPVKLSNSKIHIGYVNRF